MVTANFLEFMRLHIDNGQQQLAEAAKGYLYKNRPDLFALLDFDDDHTFLEPLLFAYISNDRTTVGLDQILFGYIQDDLRPAELQVHTDTSGVIYLPRVGYFLTEVPSRNLNMHWEKATLSYGLELEGMAVNYKFQPVLEIPGVGIEVCRRQHPLLSRFFRDAGGRTVAVDVEDVTQERLRQFGVAFTLIRSAAENYYGELVDTTRRILVFQGTGVNSFAALAAHGMAFINACLGTDEVFFAEDLVHQCGHVMFSSLTLPKQEFFVIDPDTPLRRLTYGAGETRTVYETFHGVFTELFMNQVLDWCCDSKVLNAAQQHECRGRLAFILTRFAGDLRNLAGNGIFSEKGLLIYSACLVGFLKIYEKRGDLLSSFDLRNQPYNFNYNRFLALNPLSNG